MATQDFKGTMTFPSTGGAITAMATSAEILAGTETAKAIAPDQLALSGIGVGKRTNKDDDDSPYTVVAADLAGLIILTNTGADAETEFLLPAGSDGYTFKGIVTAAYYMKITANGTEKIRYLATQTAAGGYVRSNVIGNIIQAEWSGTEWVITGIGGAWTYDA